MPVNPKTRGQEITSWHAALAMLGRQDERTIAPNTTATRVRLTSGANYISIRLHDNEIIRFYPDKIRFKDAGYKTATTKDRLNRFLPVDVWQQDHGWYYAAPMLNTTEMMPNSWQTVDYVGVNEDYTNVPH